MGSPRRSCSEDREDSHLALEIYLIIQYSKHRDKDYGVRYSRSVITIENMVGALIEDYSHHQREVETRAESN